MSSPGTKAGLAYPYRREKPRVFTGWSRPFASHGGHRDEANTALAFHRRPDNGHAGALDEDTMAFLCR